MIDGVGEGRSLWSWLHVSDIHQGHGLAAWAIDQRVVLQALLDDVAGCRQDGALPEPQAIICTGDIASTGSSKTSDEYAEAESWLRNLAAASGAGPIYLVPGNHDIQRTKPEQRQATRLLRSLRDDNENLEDVRTDSEDTAVVQSRLANFATFCDRLHSPRGAGLTGVWIELVGGCDIPIRLIGVNTAALCNDDDDKGRLALGQTEIVEVLEQLPGGELVIVLAHHPSDWLNESSSALFESVLLSENVGVLLHGHLHDAGSLLAISGTAQQLVTVSAGAVHDEQTIDPTHAYSLCAVWEGPDGSRTLRVWPRKFSVNRFVRYTDILPGDSNYAEHPLPPLPPIRPWRVSGDRETPSQVAARQLERLGQRRTAFPTDLTLAEMHSHELVVSARLERANGTECHLSDLADDVVGGLSTLVLAPPGAGKTILVYELGLELSKDSVSLPLALDLGTLEGAPPRSFRDLFAALKSNESDLTGQQVVLLIDGVDEQLAAGRSPTDLADWLRALAALSPCVVTCRELDFERQLRPVLQPDTFASILRLEPWRIEPEFNSFIASLQSANLLPDASFVEQIRTSEQLTNLVSRPLYARMLTYVAQDSAFPDNATVLYQQYLGKLAAASATATARIGCDLPDPLAVWGQAAWGILRNGTSPEAIPIDELISLFRAAGVEPRCAYRSLSWVLEVSTVGRANFVHHSFFEFLAGHHVATELQAARSSGDIQRAVAALEQDLPQEVRRHLTALLRRSVLDAYTWPAWLASVYEAADGSPERLLVVRNLAAYVACRLDVPAGEALAGLLKHEAEPFLRNSLMWALVRCDDREALDAYTESLAQDEELASLNRGYLLYYYGDIPRGTPPYRDESPHVDWEHTRDQLTKRLSEDRYRATTPARRVIDLFTFCDLARVRGATLTVQESELVHSRIDELPPSLPGASLGRLSECYEAVRPS